jgi:hypothetical protein
MAEIEKPARRGRPKTRFADHNEQVRQNMRLYRARKTAELQALARTLEVMLAALEQGDSRQTFTTAAAVAGVWKDSVLRANLLGARRARRASSLTKKDDLRSEVKSPDER